ncbi:MAG: tetratricopeptide repeat protein [Proteobacteria bacterium]|nr:tetratricopeptide repeat protein [Pseudomonadota bacterium]
MNRLLACTSVLALCAALVHPADAGDAKPATPAATSMPETLNGEILRAKDLREKGQFAEASKALRQLMLVAATDPRVASEYGKVLTQQGYAKDAVSVLTKAVQMNGSDWTLYSALGVAYDQLDDHANARKSYDRALAMKPGEPSVVNNYAVSRMLTGDYDGAVQMLSQLHSKDPKVLANLSKAEELKAAQDAKALAVQATAHAPAASAIAATTSKAGLNVVMQKVPADPHAGPVRRANSAPRTLETLAKPVLTAAASKLKVSPKDIVMQKVPSDPQAGPVKVAAQKISKPAHPIEVAKTTAKAEPKAPPPPSLRTASD